MKLANLIAKLTPRKLFNGRAQALGLLGGLVLAGAAATVAAPAASAQQFGVGVQIGGPRYVAPPAYRPYPGGYYGPAYVAPRYGFGYGYAPGYWEHQHAEQWRAHEYWEHNHGPYGRPVPYRGW